MTANKLQFEITGTADAGGNTTTLIGVAGSNFQTRRIQTGDIIYNTTDLAFATIVSIDSEIQITTTALSGANSWDLNDGYQVWVTEPYVFDITLIDTLGFPMVLEALVANNQNESEPSYYLDYQKIRVIDTDSNNNLILFYGKIETTDPYWDNQYGQVLKISARDNLAELLKRTVRTDYPSTTGYTRRSQLVKRIVDDHVYSSSNIDTTTADFDDSLYVFSSAAELASNFTGAGKNAMRAVSELSQDEQWNATPANNTGFGFDYFLDTDFLKIDGTPYVSPTGSPATPSPDLWYFQRGTIPSTDPTVQGLTVQYLGTASTTVRQMLHDYNFSTESRELITRVKAVYMTNAEGDVDTLDCILINHGAVTNGPFAYGDIISWNAGANTATVRHVGSTFLLISSANSNTTWLNTISGQGITSGIKTATVNASTATTPGSAREAIQQEIEVVTREYEKEDITNAAGKIAGLLHRSNDAILRGEFSIVRYPYYRFGGLDYVTRAGHLIRVINSNVSALGAGTNMIVTKIEYHQSTQIARISVVGTTRGKTLGRNILNDMRETAETASWETVAATGGVPASSQLVNLTKQSDGSQGIFTVVDADDITWVTAIAEYSDGSTEIIASGSHTFASATDFDWGYITKGSGALTWTQSGVTDYGAAVGINNTIVAAGRINANTGQLVAQRKAILIMINEGSPAAVDYARLKVADLSALTANLGFINAGAIRLASGTTNIIDTTGFSGFTINGDRIGGYSAGVLQTELRSSDGHFMAGNNAVELDINGIHFKGNLSEVAANFEYTGYETVYIYNDGSGNLVIGTSVTGATDVTDFNLFLNNLVFSGSTINITSDSVPATIYIGSGIVINKGKILPNLGNAVHLGDSTYYWADIYGVTLYIDSVLRRSGDGGSIGNSTDQFTDGYITNIRTDNLYTVAGTGNITLRNSLVPPAINSIDLGSSTFPIRRLYIGADAVDRYISGSGGDMEFYGAGNRTMTIKDEDPASNTTVLELRVKHGAGNTVEVVLVSLGDADSGGVGYRLMRVLNG